MLLIIVLVRNQNGRVRVSKHENTFDYPPKVRDGPKPNGHLYIYF